MPYHSTFHIIHGTPFLKIFGDESLKFAKISANSLVSYGLLGSHPSPAVGTHLRQRIFLWGRNCQNSVQIRLYLMVYTEPLQNFTHGVRFIRCVTNLVINSGTFPKALEPKSFDFAISRFLRK